MAVEFAQFTPDEYVTVTQIVARALGAGIYTDSLMVQMDIAAVHAKCPLRLADLLTADNFNFGHDMFGIKRNLNRRTGEIDNCFVPRFAAPQAPATAVDN